MELVKVIQGKVDGAFILLVNHTTKKELFGYEENTTNNRMELTAAIESLNFLKRVKS